jgi:glycyl-tRNA synthetase
VLPLLKNKEELTKAATALYDKLKLSVNCQYDEKDAIGRRYRRQDAIGTPYCITIDFETLENETVTIRERDSLEQRRIKIADVRKVIEEGVCMETLLA